MKYSFLLSLYKKEKPEYLDQCLESLSLQTYPPSETVMVFDGPVTDSLEDVVKKWKSKICIKIIRLDENIGLGKALNIGLSNCSNDIVARADTDDIYLPTRMEKQIEFLKKNPDYVIVGSNIYEFYSYPGDSNRIRKVPENYEDIKKFIKKRNPFNHMAITYSKNFIESLNGYEHHLFMEDYNLWIRALSKSNKIYNLQDILVYARIGEKNEMVSRRRGVDYVKSEYKLYKIIISSGLNGYCSATVIFLSRVLTRIMPPSLLAKIYGLIR